MWKLIFYFSEYWVCKGNILHFNFSLNSLILVDPKYSQIKQTTHTASTAPTHCFASITIPAIKGKLWTQIAIFGLDDVAIKIFLMSSRKLQGRLGNNNSRKDLFDIFFNIYNLWMICKVLETHHDAAAMI